jgi:hypothetical protein
MKFQLLSATVLVSLGGAHAFISAPKTDISRPSSSALSARKNSNNWAGPVAATAMGWALASQIAFAGMLPADQQQQQLTFSSSNLVAAEKLDFSLPSYDNTMGSSTGGFGDGTEARLGQSDSMTAPGKNEKAKEAEAMRRAEDARLLRKEEKRLAQKQLYIDQSQAADAKKKADKERVASFFGP